MESRQKILEFLIPAYKRFDGAIKAARSIANDISAYSLSDYVSIRIVDDASPGVSRKLFSDSLSEYSEYVQLELNQVNKGMSLNIFDMVRSSEASFCAILTDDDWLFPGCLVEIISCLERVVDCPEVGGVFTPRYSYLEDNSLHCVICRPFERDTLIRPGPINSLRYSHNGFILTGFVFRPCLMSERDCRTNIQNSFFPVVNFWKILGSHSILFVDRNWFHHTVLNHCHWESWGSDVIEQRHRLYVDYMDAIAYMAQNSSGRGPFYLCLLPIFFCEVREYARQIISYLHSDAPSFFLQEHVFERRFAFWVSIFIVLLYVLFRVLAVMVANLACTLLVLFDF